MQPSEANGGRALTRTHALHVHTTMVVGTTCLKREFDQGGFKRAMCMPPSSVYYRQHYSLYMASQIVGEQKLSFGHCRRSAAQQEHSYSASLALHQPVVLTVQCSGSSQKPLHAECILGLVSKSRALCHKNLLLKHDNMANCL